MTQVEITIPIPLFLQFGFLLLMLGVPGMWVLSNSINFHMEKWRPYHVAVYVSILSFIIGCLAIFIGMAVDVISKMF